MINLAVKELYKSIIKQPINVKLSKTHHLKRINIFAVPTRIKNNDINAMFNGLLKLVMESCRQEQSEKYLQLKLQYSRLQYLYNK